MKGFLSGFLIFASFCCIIAVDIMEHNERSPKILYASTDGLPTNPCTQFKPCDINTGIRKSRERVWGRTVNYSGLTPEEITRMSQMP